MRCLTREEDTFIDKRRVEKLLCLLNFDVNTKRMTNNNNINI